MPIVADAAVALRADLSKYKDDLKQGDRVTQDAGSRWQRALSPQNVGRAFQAVGATAGAAFAGSVELASKFEDQLRTINTVAGLTDAELATLGDGIQQLARDSGKSTEDLTGAYYDLVSAGIPAEQAMDVLKNSATLATGALSTTGESVDLITSALNAYGMEATESGRLTDIFAKTVESGKVTAAELASTIAQIAPIAANAGIEIEEVASGYAQLTAKGVPAAQASTQMRAAISSLLTPNEKLNALQQQTGINFAELARDQGLSVALEELRKATEGNATALDALATVSAEDFPAALADAQDALGLTNSDLEKFQRIAGKDGVGAAMAELTKQVGAGDSAFAMSLGSVEAYSFALNSTGASFDGAQDSLADFQGGIDGLATDQAAEKMKSPTEAAARMTQQFLTFMQDVGGPFAGTLGPVLMTLNNLGPALGGLISPAKLAGGLIGGLAGKLAAGVAGLVPALGGAFAAAGSTIGGVFTAAAGAVIAAWPLVLLALVVAAIALLLTNPEIRAKAIEIGGSIVNAIGQALGAVAGVLGQVGSAIIGAVGGFVGTVVGFIIAIPGRVAGWVGGLVGQAASAGGQVVGAIGNAIGQVVGFVLGIPGRVASWVGSLVGQAASAGAQVVGAISQAVGQAVGFVLGIPGRVASWVGSLVGQAASAGAQVVGAIGNAIGQVVGFVLGIPGRAIGGWLRLGSMALDAGGRIVSAITGAAGQVVNTILGIPARAAGFVGDLIGMAGRAVSGFIGQIAAIPGKVGEILGGVGDFVGGLIPSFQSGTMYAPEGLAYLHEGEIVVPPNMAEAVRGLMAGGGGMAGSGGGTTVQIYNPSPEPAGTSAAREMNLLSAMGVMD